MVICRTANAKTDGNLRASGERLGRAGSGSNCWPSVQRSYSHLAHALCESTVVQSVCTNNLMSVPRYAASHLERLVQSLSKLYESPASDPHQRRTLPILVWSVDLSQAYKSLRDPTPRIEQCQAVRLTSLLMSSLPCEAAYLAISWISRTNPCQ